jgi:hypothetical protein
VAISSLLVVLFIAWSFRGVQNAFRYGICAILAMIHDVAIIFSITAIGGLLFGWEIDSLFLTALLTVIGFSMQDTIVVFDRVRENTNIYRRLDFETLVNQYPINDGGIPALGACYVWRCDPTGVFHCIAGRPDERYLFIYFHRRAHPGALGKQGMEDLVPT